MQYRMLGRTGLRVSDVGFGAMTIGGEVFGGTDDTESLRALRRALDLGMNFIDTADAAEKDARRGLFPEEDLAQIHAAVEKLHFLVKGDVPNLAQAALRFILSNSAVSTVIPGIRTVRQVEENLMVRGKTLPAEDVTKLRALYRSEFCHLSFH